MSPELVVLLTAAASVGVIHTLLGPDHYVPFIALARSERWTLRRTLAVTTWCGIGHVVGSIALGMVGLGLGWLLGAMVAIESLRGELAGWMLLGFGLAYAAWGTNRALRGHHHDHPHAHADGLVHRHDHDHRADHIHLHARGSRRWLAPWTLFVVFVLGPCEPLIPLFFAPAALGNWVAVAGVAVVFAVATIATMVAMVAAGTLGLSRLPMASFERWSHSMAGIAIALSGAAVQFLGL